MSRTGTGAAAPTRQAYQDEKVRRLESVTDADLADLTVEDLLVELLDRIQDLLQVDTAAVLLLDPSGRFLRATAARGLEEEVWQGVRIPVGAGFAGRIAATGQPVQIYQVDHTNVVNPLLLDKGLASVLGVPMIASGSIIGVLHIGTKTPRRFRRDDVDLLRRVADRVSLATQTRAAGIDRAAAIALQQSLLPAVLPAVSNLDLASRYVPGAQTGVGGDWYDVFALPSGNVGIAIGDVAGRGLRAAVVMGRIRSALRAYALESDDPADVLTRLDRKIQLFEPGAMATAIYALITPSAEIVMSLAGHLPPVLVEEGQPARLMDTVTDVPLGVFAKPERRQRTYPLRPGSLLFLYTDGLVERRDRPITDGLRQLIATLVTESAEVACLHAMAALVGAGPPDDDIAVLALRTDGGRA